MGERYLAVVFAAEKKKGPQIERSSLDSIEGEQSSEKITLKWNKVQSVST